GLFQVDAGQLDDDPVVAFWPHHRLRVAARVYAPFEDVQSDVAGIVDGHSRADVRDLQLQVGAPFQVEPLVDVDVLLDTKEWDRERRTAVDRPGERLVGGHPVDVRVPVNKSGDQGDRDDQEQQIAVGAHLPIESIGRGHEKV